MVLSLIMIAVAAIALYVALCSDPCDDWATILQTRHDKDMARKEYDKLRPNKWLARRWYHKMVNFIF